MTPLYIAVLCVGGGPFGAAITQATPEKPPIEAVAAVEVTEATVSADDEWEAVEVADTTIELPKVEAIETQEYQRTAPANYVMPKPTKTVPRWCPVPGPRHGFACGMTQSVEDLAGHLQSVHGESLERLNEIGRAKWQDLHDDIHWAEETAERQDLFLNPRPAKPAPSRSGCASGNCPSGNCPTFSGRRFGIF